MYVHKNNVNCLSHSIFLFIKINTEIPKILLVKMYFTLSDNPVNANFRGNNENFH